MKRAEKEQLVTELKQKMEGAQALYFTDFTGLNVKRMTELRRRLRRAGVDYVVIKNSLALRAVNESGLTGAPLKGPTGVVVARDPIGAAKVLVTFAKENDQRPALKSGLFEGAQIDEAQMKKLATMPTREEALGQFVSALNSVLMMFALALEARRTQLEEGGEPSSASGNAAGTSDAASDTTNSTDTTAAAGAGDAVSDSGAAAATAETTGTGTAEPAANDTEASTPDAPSTTEPESTN